MKVNDISEPYKSKVIDILTSENDSDAIANALKLYVLREPYFKELYSEPTYIANSIFIENKGYYDGNNRR